jgi:hypothetical protein
MSDPVESEPPTSHAEPKPVRDRGRLTLAVIAAIAVVALGLSAWAVLRPYLPEHYSDGERTDAKTKTCEAFDTVRRGVQINTNMQAPGGPQDVTGTLAVAGNARVSMYGGGLYLQEQLDPATPTDLADEVRKFANALVAIGAAATAGSQNSDPEQAARLREADQANLVIIEKCK